MRGFEQIPWLYDLSMRLLEPLGIGRLRQRVTSKARGRVLEVGCGTGRNLPLYPIRPVALEIDLRMLLAARKRARAAGVDPIFVMGNTESLPFREDDFDTVVSSLVFCSVPDPDRGLAEIRRTLKPTGRLWMLEHVRSSGLFGHLQDAVQPAWTLVVGGCYPNRETEKRVEAAGFTIDTQSRLARGVIRFFVARLSDGSKTPESVSSQVDRRSMK